MGDFSFSGGVEVTGFISPTDTTDTYPVIDTLYGIDGLRNVNNLTQLNAIPNERRRSGMLVGVSGGTQYYKLNSSPWSGTTDDWSIFTTDGGTFTGNTSGDCITDFYVSNVYGCSPVQFQSPIIIGDNPSLSADTFETSFIVGTGNTASSTQTDTIYYENFDTGFDCGGCGPSITGGWYVSGTTGNQFDDSAQINGLDSTCNSCVASPSSGYFGASGGNGIELVDDPSLGMAFIALSGVSTVGYDTISVSWGAYNDDLGSGLGVAFEVSNDGGITWSGTTYTDTILGGPWELINGGIPIVLPGNMGEQTNTAYRWIFDTSNGNLDAYYIDDFFIYGDFTPSSTTINNLMIIGDDNKFTNTSLKNINIIGSNITASTNSQTYIENLTVTSAITFDNLTTGATEEFHLTLDSSNVVRKSDNIWARGTGSRSVLLGPKESIGSATASGTNSLSIGTSTDAIGLRSKAFGTGTISSGENATADGKRTYAAGDNSYAGGQGASGGEELIASGETSFVHFRYDTFPPVTNLRLGAYGDYSAILGGKNHNIDVGAESSAIFAGSSNTIQTGVTNSVVLGGSNITGTTNDTVYVPNLNLCEFGGTLYTSSISGCSPITIGEANFPQGITVSGESVSTENQTEIFSTQLINRTMDSGTTITVQSFVANYKHPSGGINTSQIFFRPSDVTSRETIIYGTPGVVHADYGTVDVAILGLGPTETIKLTGTTTGTTTVSFGWNGVPFSGTVTVNSSIPPP